MVTSAAALLFDTQMLCCPYFSLSLWSRALITFVDVQRFKQVRGVRTGIITVRINLHCSLPAEFG